MKKGIIAALSTIGGAAAGAVVIGKMQGKALEQKTAKVDKFKSYYNMLNQWLILKQEGKMLTSYFKEKGYYKIAIYGMGEMGSRLYDELRNTEIKVAYAIDSNAESIYSELEIHTMEDNLENVDAVVVSAIFAFFEVEEKLREQLNCPVISLEDVVYKIQ